MTNKEAAQIIMKMFDEKELNLPIEQWQALAEARNALKYVDKLERKIDKLNKKYQKALDIAADEYRMAAMCSKNFCPRYNECMKRVVNGAYHASEEECKAFALESWKKEAELK